MHNNNAIWWGTLAGLPLLTLLFSFYGYTTLASVCTVIGLILYLAQIAFSSVSIILHLFKEQFQQARKPTIALIAAVLLMVVMMGMVWYGGLGMEGVKG
jgi:uncharacterized membrane protein